jgi:2-methylcitrate dehydratase PrpD
VSVQTTVRSLIDTVIAETSSISYQSTDETTLAYLRVALLDWIGVTVAGSTEASSGLVRQVLRAEGGSAQATALGAGQFSARQAALANGVAGHALDYDDMGLGGAHPSAVIVAAVLAMAEREHAGGEVIAEALLAGYQALALVSYAAGWGPYRRGFHTTGTVGTIAAAAACAQLLGLDAPRRIATLGLAATQAAGLKASFGSMAKHLNAGQAAANGVLAADLATVGFTAADDALQDPQGFLSTHGDPADVDLERAPAVLGGENAVRQLLFKVHASCGGTHSSIDSVAAALLCAQVEESAIERIELTVSADLIGMCGIPSPRTGLEGKFSLRHAAAVAVRGLSTGPSGFTDEAVRDARTIAMRERVVVTPSDALAVDGPAEVVLVLNDGRRVGASVNPYVATPPERLAELATVLAAKFTELTTPVLGRQRSEEVMAAVATFDRFPRINDLTALLKANPNDL